MIYALRLNRKSETEHREHVPANPAKRKKQETGPKKLFFDSLFSVQGQLDRKINYR